MLWEANVDPPDLPQVLCVATGNAVPHSAFLKALLSVAPVVENAACLSDWVHRTFDGSEQGGG